MCTRIVYKDMRFLKAYENVLFCFCSKEVNFEELARCTDDFNGAQLKAVCVEAVSKCWVWSLEIKLTVSLSLSDVIKYMGFYQTQVNFTVTSCLSKNTS